MAENKWCILIANNLAENQDFLNLLQEKFELVSLEKFLLNPTEYEAKIDGICGLVGSPLLTEYVKDEHFLSKLSKVRVLFSLGIGTDHLDLTELWNKGIQVATTGKINALSTAEFGFALMMASARNLTIGIKALKDGKDVSKFWQTQSGTRLSGATLGIIGMGSIGHIVAERGAAFGMDILYHNRSQRSKEDEEKVKATYCETLDNLLVQSDFVMLCVPLTKDTKCLIGEKELKLMKSTAVLVNISRGDVVDQDALVKALQDNSIKGAALDVTTPEPLPPDHPLLHMPNVIVTPHNAGSTEEAVRDEFQAVVDNLLAGLEGKIMPNEIQPQI